MLSREAIQDQAHLLALRPDLELRLQDLEVVLDRLLACWIEIEGVEGLLVDLRAQLVHLRGTRRRRPKWTRPSTRTRRRCSSRDRRLPPRSVGDWRSSTKNRDRRGRLQADFDHFPRSDDVGTRRTRARLFGDCRVQGLGTRPWAVYKGRPDTSYTSDTCQTGAPQESAVPPWPCYLAFSVCCSKKAFAQMHSEERHISFMRSAATF